jgi:GxxExxY protein
MQDAERKALNDLSYRIIAAAIEVHRALGPGLLESIYRTCLMDELKVAGIDIAVEQTVPVQYKGITLEDRYRLGVRRIING